MPLPDILRNRLRLPVIGAPMFIVSNPALVIAQCKAGIVGAFAALSARPAERLDDWLAEIVEELAAHNRRHPDQPAAPFAVNQIVHKTNVRLEADLETCAKHKVPIVITSLGARAEIFEAIHSFGAFCLHDVINDGFGRKAVERGADGLIAVCAGAGGHAGSLSPFALVREIRQWFSGTLALSGAIGHGASVLAAQAAGADLAYIGSAFIATTEANAVEGYKQMVVQGAAEDILYTDFFSGVRGNYLKPSIIAAGLDPENLAASDPSKMNFASGGAKVWRDVWGCGQGIGAIREIESAADRVERLAAQYREARLRLVGATG
jgi:nitronate monooxygenase